MRGCEGDVSFYSSQHFIDSLWFSDGNPCRWQAGGGGGGGGGEFFSMTVLIKEVSCGWNISHEMRVQSRQMCCRGKFRCELGLVKKSPFIVKRQDVWPKRFESAHRHFAWMPEILKRDAITNVRNYIFSCLYSSTPLKCHGLCLLTLAYARSIYDEVQVFLFSLLCFSLHECSKFVAARPSLCKEGCGPISRRKVSCTSCLWQVDCSEDEDVQMIFEVKRTSLWSVKEGNSVILYHWEGVCFKLLSFFLF